MALADFMEGSDQYEWLVKDLETVNRKVTPWIVYLGKTLTCRK